MARGRFQPAEFERKWQEWWDAQGIYYARDDDTREKYYNLMMFPYPSGDLHIGHWYNYTGGDIYGRYMRMRGYNVTQPIGFDAFGLPAENAAIKRNVQPREWTLDNIGKMQAQMRLLSLDAMALPPVLQAGLGLPDQSPGELVPALQHDAGQ
jgi:leucyl-tRNA synthetase